MFSVVSSLGVASFAGASSFFGDATSTSPSVSIVT